MTENKKNKYGLSRYVREPIKVMSKLYPDFGHPEGIGARPWFTIRGDKLYPAFGHPEGIRALPWFKIR